MNKKEARRLMLNKRMALSNKACIQLDDLLLIQFQQLNWLGMNRLANFYPMPEKNEPNSLLLAKYIKTMFPNIQICYPIIAQESSSMDFYLETDKVELNTWGIPEPLPVQKIPPSAIDVMLLPLLGFDAKGHRIGFGKGYYDRYLTKETNNIQKIGISYFEPMPNIVETNQFDVPLNSCITPWNIYEFE